MPICASCLRMAPAETRHHEPAARSATSRHGRTPTRRGWLLSSPVLAIAFVPLFANWQFASRRGDTTTRDFAHDLLNSVEPYGILVTAGDNDTFPLWYAQHVEGIRRDVTLANLSLMNTRWHLRQLQRRETPQFDPARAAALWRPRPAESGVPLTDSTRAKPVAPTWPHPKES